MASQNLIISSQGFLVFNMLRVLIALTSLLIFNTGVATTVLPVSLGHMAQSAAVIFYGRVVSNEVRLDEVSQRVATFTTFEVLEAIKGISTDSYTLKQVGGQLPGSPLVTRVYGVPQFNVGSEYVVFLPQPSRLGFASPIGLSQGSYPVSSDAGGNKTVASRRSEGDPAADSSAASRGAPGTGSRTALPDFLQKLRTLSQQ